MRWATGAIRGSCGRGLCPARRARMLNAPMGGNRGLRGGEGVGLIGEQSEESRKRGVEACG